jgi:hypothetical protein
MTSRSLLSAKTLYFSLSCFIDNGIAASTIEIGEPQMERHGVAPDPANRVEGWLLGPDWQLKDAPSHYLPQITGTMSVGSTLIALAGPNEVRWREVTYQWLRDGVPIAGALTSTYELNDADIGKTIALATRGMADFHLDAAEMFTAETPVRGYDLAAGAPSVSGVARVGRVLTVAPGTWSAGTLHSYRWLRNGGIIAGATQRDYKLAEEDRGQRIAVCVTGSKPLFTPVTKTVLGAGSVAPRAAKST